MTLIYGILRVLDMSQGSMVMVGGFVGWAIMTERRPEPALAIARGVRGRRSRSASVTQLVSVQPLLGKRGIDFEMITFITTFAVAIIIANVALQIARAARSATCRRSSTARIELYDGVTLSYQSMIMAGVAIALMVGLGVYLARSRYGIRDPRRRPGPRRRPPDGRADPARVPARRWASRPRWRGSPACSSPRQYFASPSAGDQPLLIALIVVIFGGLGSLPGAIFAAYAIGLIQATASTLVGTTWSLPILYGVILLLLVIRPQGLLGQPTEARL